jgi:hypothetical protein
MPRKNDMVNIVTCTWMKVIKWMKSLDEGEHKNGMVNILSHVHG